MISSQLLYRYISTLVGCTLSRNNIYCIVLAHEICMGLSTSNLLEFGPDGLFAIHPFAHIQNLFIHSFIHSSKNYLLRILIQ